MLAYMGTVLVILLNILIAQMSTTYTQAKRVARLEYDVDRILLLSRMESCSLLVCKRHEMDRVELVCARACSRLRASPPARVLRNSEYHFALLSIGNLTDFYFCNSCRLCRIYV